jgi:hypothetical protein
LGRLLGRLEPRAVKADVKAVVRELAAVRAASDPTILAKLASALARARAARLAA